MGIVNLNNFGLGLRHSLNCIGLFFQVLANPKTRVNFKLLLVYNLPICLLFSLLLETYLSYLRYYTVYYFYRVLVILFWSLPHYLIGLMYNSYYTNQSISDFIQVYNPQNLNLSYQCYVSYSKYLVNKAYYLVIVTFLTIETAIISQIPYIGTSTDWFLTSLIYSYYSWEYSWSSHKIPHQERYAIFEHNWCYYLGYGSLLGLLKITLGFFHSTYLIACLFPIFAMNTLLLYHQVDRKTSAIKLPLFYLPICYANLMVQKFAYYLKGKIT